MQEREERREEGPADCRVEMVVSKSFPPTLSVTRWLGLDSSEDDVAVLVSMEELMINFLFLTTFKFMNSKKKKKLRIVKLTVS